MDLPQALMSTRTFCQRLWQAPACQAIQLEGISSSLYELAEGSRQAERRAARCTIFTWLLRVGKIEQQQNTRKSAKLADSCRLCGRPGRRMLATRCLKVITGTQQRCRTGNAASKSLLGPSHSIGVRIGDPSFTTRLQLCRLLCK